LSSLVCCFAATRALPQTVTFKFETVSPEVVTQRLELVPSKDAEREIELKKMFQQAGCEKGRLQEQVVRSKDPPNVICTLPGTTGSLIIVGAHFDHAESGKGAVDDWSGASLLPSLYQAVSGTPRKHTFVFIGFTDEEKGLVGSNFYVKHLPIEQLTAVQAMVNLECLGVGPTEVWARAADKRLMIALIDITQYMHVELKGMNVENVGNDDTQAFRDKKLPVITIHSLTQQTLPILHSPRDTLAAVHLDELFESYRVVAEYLAFIDGLLD
jgi:aminopeptidase-like protein